MLPVLICMLHVLECNCSGYEVTNGLNLTHSLGKLIVSMDISSFLWVRERSDIVGS